MFSSFVSSVNAVVEKKVADVLSLEAADTIGNISVGEPAFDAGLVTLSVRPFVVEEEVELQPLHIDYYGTGDSCNLTSVLKTGKESEWQLLFQSFNLGAEHKSAMMSQRGRMWGSCAYHALVYRLVLLYMAIKTGSAAGQANYQVPPEQNLHADASLPDLRSAREGYLIPDFDMTGAEITGEAKAAISVACKANLGCQTVRGGQPCALYSGVAAVGVFFNSVPGPIQVNAAAVMEGLTAVLRLCPDPDSVLMRALEFAASKAQFIHHSAAYMLGSSGYGSDYEVGKHFLSALSTLGWDDVDVAHREEVLATYFRGEPTIGGVKISAARAGGLANGVCQVRGPAGGVLEQYSYGQLTSLMGTQVGLDVLVAVGRALRDSNHAHRVTLWKAEKLQGRHAMGVETRDVVPTGWGAAVLTGEPIEPAACLSVLSERWLCDTIFGLSLAMRVSTDLLVRMIGVNQHTLARWTDAVYSSHVAQSLQVVGRPAVERAWRQLSVSPAVWITWVRAVARLSPFTYFDDKVVQLQAKGSLDVLQRPLGDRWAMDVVYSEYDLTFFWPVGMLPAQCCYTYTGEDPTISGSISEVVKTFSTDQILGKSPAMLAELFARAGVSCAMTVKLLVDGVDFYTTSVSSGGYRWRYTDLCGNLHIGNRLDYVCSKGAEKISVVPVAGEVFDLSEGAPGPRATFSSASNLLHAELSRALTATTPGSSRMLVFTMGQVDSSGVTSADLKAALVAAWKSHALAAPSDFRKA